MRTLVWFRGKDLRIADHAPLRQALDAGDELLCLFVLSPRYFTPDGASRCPHRMQFLLQSLASLRDNLAHLGSELLLVRGPASVAVPKLAAHWRVDRVLAQSTVEPSGRARDEAVRAALEVPLTLVEGETLVPPGSILTQSNEPYAVYSAFARNLRGHYGSEAPLPTPRKLPPPPEDLDRRLLVSLPALKELHLHSNDALQQGGERAARRRLRAFLKGPAAEYASGRERMDLEGTSRLSADLKFGTLSVREVFHAASQTMAAGESRDRYLGELVWREFAHHTLWHRPRLLEEPFRDDFKGFPWRRADAAFERWAEGRTGYPIVDAAARQLLEEGFVHNRARMIAASFLCKHLLLPWWRGEAHYLKWLTDGDPANNNLGWQWSSGSGCDAQPYFRVFNPMTQGARFDPEGAYVRRYVPELAKLSTKHIHAPWKAPDSELEDAGVELGQSYPLPCVDHKAARERFLETARDHLKGD